MRDAREWAGEIADRLLAGQPVMKAHGAAVRREQLVKALKPACRPLADLERELERQREQITALLQTNWQDGGQVTGPFPRGRFQPFDASEWTTQLTKTQGDAWPT